MKSMNNLLKYRRHLQQSRHFCFHFYKSETLVTLLLTEVSEVSALHAEHVRQSQRRERSFQVDLGVGGEPEHEDRSHLLLGR